jgi:hypothetical protein
MASDAAMGVLSAGAIAAGFAIGGPVGGAIAGSLVSAFGSIAGSSAKRKQEEAIAREKRLQALEVARRTASELDMLSDEINKNIGSQVAGFAGSGIDVGSGSSIQAQMASFENYGRTVLNKNLESKFRIRQLNVEAANGISLSKDAQTASIIGAFGSLAESGVKLSGTIGSTPTTTTAAPTTGTPNPVTGGFK